MKWKDGVGRGLLENWKKRALGIIERINFHEPEFGDELLVIALQYYDIKVQEIEVVITKSHPPASPPPLEVGMHSLAKRSTILVLARPLFQNQYRQFLHAKHKEIHLYIPRIANCFVGNFGGPRDLLFAILEAVIRFS
jgi:hypothetical protein